MDNVEVIELNRVFRMGTIDLDDPAPEKPPQEALALYAGSYPMLANASLEDPVVEGGKQVYVVIKPSAKTKG